jgi:hypothetical protein
MEKFPPVTDTVIEYRDTIIPVFIHSVDTVEKWGTIRDTLIVNSGTAHGKTWVIHDTLRLQVWQSDTTLQVKLDSAIQVIRTKEQFIKEVQKKSVFDKIIISLSLILAIILVIFVQRFFHR